MENTRLKLLAFVSRQVRIAKKFRSLIYVYIARDSSLMSVFEFITTHVAAASHYLLWVF